jgi:hypothetical protein
MKLIADNEFRRRRTKAVGAGPGFLGSRTEDTRLH